MPFIELLDLRPPLRVASTHGFRGTLNQTSRSAQRRLLNDFIPSKDGRKNGWGGVGCCSSLSTFCVFVAPFCG